MNLGELKTELDDLVGRTDYTAAKQTTHINRAIRRIQTLTQLPDMEATVELTLDENKSVAIPSDYRELRVIYEASTFVPFEKIDINQMYKIVGETPYTEQPRPFFRLMERWYFPGGTEGDDIQVVYYASWDALESDEDYNELTTLAPEAIIYGAASYAATYFHDSRVMEFEDRFKAEVEELELDRWQAEISTGSGQVIQAFEDPELYPGGY
jgi:hypothetical protein